MKSYSEEFYRQYEQPHIGKLIVGFSGIDPSRKTFVDVIPSNLDGEQLKVIEEIILNYISKLEIHVDSGNIDPEADEPEPQYINQKPSEIPHEGLGGLMGGSEDGHYHLTEDELSRLSKVIEALMPDGETIELPDVSNHEELLSLFGGDNDGHYHLTNEQLVKLSKLIKLFYPNGESDPVIPTPTPDPIPDDPETDPDSEPEDLFGGLPKGTPPAWKIQAFPSGYIAHDGAHRMYYGDVPDTYTTTTPDTLLAFMKKKNNEYHIFLMRTMDGQTWDEAFSCPIASLSKNSNGSYDDYGWGTGADGFVKSFMGKRYRLYMLGTSIYKYRNNHIHYLDSYANSSGNVKFHGSSLTDSFATTATGYTAGCYSPLINIYIFVSPEGIVTQVQNDKVINNTSNVRMPINPGCAAWSPDQCVFCVTGPDGTATSATGQAWTLHTDAPKDLRDMSYREDLGCFFAWSGSDKLFYVSGNGADWIRFTTTPIPLEEVACLDYSPEIGWYAAIGSGKSITAYFSKDLKHWIGTTVTNGVEIEMNSIKYIARAGKYILMPKSGDYYYLFDTTEWTDS